MRGVGLALFGAGMLAGAYFLVEIPNAVRWEAMGPSLGVAAIGLIVMRASGRPSVTDEVAQQGMQRAKDALSELCAKMRAHADEAMPDYIDGQLMPSLDAFVQVRTSIQQAHGLDAYASVMDRFAQGERALNRAWSAGADGYPREAERSFRVALGRFEEAASTLERL